MNAAKMTLVQCIRNTLKISLVEDTRLNCHSKKNKHNNTLLFNHLLIKRFK